MSEDQQVNAREIVNSWQEINATIVTGVHEFGSVMRQVNDAVIAARPYIINFTENIKRLPDRTRYAQRKLAERSWYLLPQVPASIILQLVEMFDADYVEAVDALMIQMVEHYLEEVEAKLIIEFPRRESSLEAAFALHREERYVASVPLFLMQADGICEETLGTTFFYTKVNNEEGVIEPLTRAVIESLQLEVFTEMMLEPLMSAGSISSNPGESKRYPNILNRHEIVHGQNTEYATKINSLKAISLVGYLGGLVHSIMTEAKETRGQQGNNLPSIGNLNTERMSPLGRDLVEISAEIEASGEGLLSYKNVEREVKRRRGGTANVSSE